MRYMVSLLLVSCVSCASTPQTVLRNEPPYTTLDYSLDVLTREYLGFGGAIGGGLVLTADHIGGGRPVVRWRWRNESGAMNLVRRYREQDLALYRVEGSIAIPQLIVSDETPRAGEEVYWSIRGSDAERSIARGWVLTTSGRWITVDGWFHPGTSGSPVLRADGTLIGIAVGGRNWSCLDAVPFADRKLADQLECLDRRSGFNAEMIVSPTIGGV